VIQTVLLLLAGGSEVVRREFLQQGPVVDELSRVVASQCWAAESLAEDLVAGADARGVVCGREELALGLEELALGALGREDFNYLHKLQ
jgi:hypothetical protein